MIDRIALKRLTASDLTFFETLFRTLGAGNQKAINLNADVFVERLYPALPGLVPILGDMIPLTMTVLGPAGASPYVMSRAITKGEAYKNWRLNGEFVRDPEGEFGRFNVLKAGDLAVMEFEGEPGPQRLTLQLLAAASPIDAPLHSALNPLIPGGRHTMVQITRGQIATAAAQVSPTHPIWRMATDAEFDAALEDAALSGIKGSDVLKTKATKVVTAAALAAAKVAAELNGREGEALAWLHLQKMKQGGALASIEWSSRENAVSSFDFRAVDSSGAVIRIDAKSTSGEFARMVHMSAAELLVAADGERYDLWRIYEINQDGARLRISENMGVVAKTILSGMSLPAGVTLDSVSIDPKMLKWGSEIAIERPDEAV
jgi:hypothetical protein